jgi:hypothetical protein
MLASHEKGSEHVGYIPVGNSTPIFILLSAECGHHVTFILRECKDWWPPTG